MQTLRERILHTLTTRLTGVSIPLGGLQWNPKPDDREAIRKLVVFLEDRRVLHIDETGDLAHKSAHHLVYPEWVMQSILETRQRVTNTLEELDFDATPKAILEEMRAACRRVARVQPVHRAQQSPVAILDLGRFRKIMGMCIGGLCIGYKIDPGANLKRLVHFSVQDRKVKP